MPWPSVPYTDITLRQDLTECFNVRGIPYLVLIDNDGNIITENGRAEVTDDPDGLVKYLLIYYPITIKTNIIVYLQYFPWRKRFVYSLSSRLLPKLQSYPAIVLFIEGDQEEELELAEGVLLPVAQQVAKTKTNALYDLLFFIAPDVCNIRVITNFVHMN